MTRPNVVIDGYDLLAEAGRIAFEDVTLHGRSLNRGSAIVDFDGSELPGEYEARQRHDENIVVTTLDSAKSPAIDLSYPATGMFVASARGVYLDLYQGVGQKLLDMHHPRFKASIAALHDSGLIFRREINTDDYEYFSERIPGIVEPQELAVLVNQSAGSSFPGRGAFKCFFSNSGAEAGEAAIKLAMLFRYRRLVGKFGARTLAGIMADLKIGRDEFFDSAERADEPVFRDYPFFVIGCSGAFHGRTLGVLGLTRSKGVQQIGFGKLRWLRHVSFNGDVQEFRDLLDTRPLKVVLDSPGGIAGVIGAGRIPVDLVAAFVTEVYQGEGGYRIADRDWLSGIVAECRLHEILVGVDEVQSFGRTGRLFAAEHYDLEPDIVWMAKSSVLGITAIRRRLADVCTPGWHSNTFGSGKLFDVNMAFATIDVLQNYRDPVFEHRTYLENSRIKGEYLRLRLAELLARYEDVFVDFSGLGGMWGLSVRHRESVIEWGWRYGAKLLGCGLPGEVSRIRILLLADVLTREIDQLIGVLDRVFEKVSALHEE